MAREFRDVEIAFQDLRRKFRAQAISRREFIDQLKKLRLRDGEGRFWMLGAQSGKWYFFDGREWVRAEPALPKKKPVKCLSCGQELESGAEECDRCGASLGEDAAACARCGAKLESASQKCPNCSAEVEAASPGEEWYPESRKENYVFRRLNPVSAFFFSGATGILLGLAVGALAGASRFFSRLAPSLPEFLSTIKGTLTGGIVFAVLGGILGFVLLGALGFLQALLFNGVSSVAGGLKITLDPTGEREKPPAASE